MEPVSKRVRLEGAPLPEPAVFLSVTKDAETGEERLEAVLLDSELVFPSPDSYRAYCRRLARIFCETLARTDGIRQRPDYVIVLPDWIHTDTVVAVLATAAVVYHVRSSQEFEQCLGAFDSTGSDEFGPASRVADGWLALANPYKQVDSRSYGGRHLRRVKRPVDPVMKTLNLECCYEYVYSEAFRGGWAMAYYVVEFKSTGASFGRCCKALRQVPIFSYALPGAPRRQSIFYNTPTSVSGIEVSCGFTPDTLSRSLEQVACFTSFMWALALLARFNREWSDCQVTVDENGLESVPYMSHVILCSSVSQHDLELVVERSMDLHIGCACCPFPGLALDPVREPLPASFELQLQSGFVPRNIPMLVGFVPSPLMHRGEGTPRIVPCHVL